MRNKNTTQILTERRTRLVRYHGWNLDEIDEQDLMNTLARRYDCSVSFDGECEEECFNPTAQEEEEERLFKEDRRRFWEEMEAEEERKYGSVEPWDPSGAYHD